MKKFILISILALFAIGLQAQTLSSGESYYRSGTLTDETSATDSTIDYTIVKYELDSVAVRAYIDIDTSDASVHTAGAVTVALQSKQFNVDSYVTVQSATWTSATDTTIRLVGGFSTHTFWRWLMTGSDNDVRIAPQVFELEFNRK